MFIEVTAWTAFTAGVLSFFSPCLLPLVPAYIMYLSGTFDQEDLSKKRLFTVLQTLGFILGFTLVFMIMGVSASALGQLFARHKMLLGKISGVVIVFFGLNMMGILKIPFLTRDHRKTRQREHTTFLSAVGIGMAFAFGWTPCFGPILGAILASTAAMSKNVAEGVWQLFIYSMGMAVPFLLTAIFIDFFDRHVSWMSRHAGTLNRIAGAFMVILGLLIATGKMYLISNWLLNFLGTY